ncbi:multicopper oxidase domain-containing protein [Actinomyces bowdenii]|uniref:Copper-containing nitrite reductase n=1 Tax=Actinomyces bowdenii TaxID=131109 RepID=A0A3P1V812_9ACTO|nr:multicopper oxidase domain-containing protein [Actinomyces bowdenii]RRD30332.1 copper oxidase [Actinomyces bowdenii]
MTAPSQRSGQDPQDDPTAGPGPAPAGRAAAPEGPEGGEHEGSEEPGARGEAPSSPAPRSGRRAVTAGTSPAPARPGRPSPGSAAVPAAPGADRRGVIMGVLTVGAAVAAGGAMALRGGQSTTAGSGGQGVAATGRTVELTVTAKGMRFVPGTVEVAPGDRLVITLDNPTELVHDLVLETGATTGRIAAGATGTLDAGIITGPTEGWCSIAGHRAQGMVLHITTSGAAGTAGPGESSPGGQSGHGDHSSHAGQEGQAAAPDYEAQLPEGFTAVDAALPPAPSASGGPITHRHTLTVTERVMEVGAGCTQRRMTFNGRVPGPVLRGSVGDTFEITLVNDGTMSHSIDFHAGITPPDEAMRSIDPGQSLDYRFTAQHSGIWLYHCSTAPMSLHLAAGMHGAVIIDPPGLGAVDKEFIVVASEVYLGAEGGEPDSRKIAAKAPDLMTFNGVAFQYAQRPLEASVGQRLRFWVLDAGPSLATSFHIVGLQFDEVFHEGAWTLGGPQGIGQAWSGGSQALGLQPAQGGFVECVAQEPGNYVLVTHSFADMEKGAKGVLRVTA